jgi:type IV pilus assembly protein PilM
MKKNVLGIEIGNSRLKIVEVNRGNVVRFQCYDLPDNMVQGGSVVSWDALVEVLRNCIHAGGFQAKLACLVLPESECYVKPLSMPPMTEAQLMVNLPYEYQDAINGEKDNYIFDYAMKGIINDENGNPVEMQLLGAMVHKDLIQKYTELFRKAGLKLIKAVPRPLALQVLAKYYNPEFYKQDYAFLDLGNDMTIIDYFHNGVYDVNSTIDSGVRAIVQAVAETLHCDPHVAAGFLQTNKDDIIHNEALVNVYSTIAIEIMRGLNFYSFDNQDNTLEKVYYYGGGAWITPFLEEIAGDISLELLPISSLSPNTPADAMINGAVALGACLD